MKKYYFLVFLLTWLCFSLPLVSAATIKGFIYNDKLDLEKDVLIEVNSTPAQKLLSKDGSYEFSLPLGTYLLSARKGLTDVSESLELVKEGTFTVDLFLLPEVNTEEELWKAVSEPVVDESLLESSAKTEWWRYFLIILILALLGWRYVRMRRKYGPLSLFRRQMKIENAKTIEQHKEEIAKEPGYLEEALEVIKKHDGRITQKKLRSEMLHLSEAKISLILTELEHKQKVEKIKKGRGNVIILKNQ